IERRMANPIVDIQHFKTKAFSLSLGSNVAYHFSMLATMTLVPILVEKGFGREPIFVTFVLLPSQILGLFMPMVAGWVYDRYRPRLLRPGTMILIAGGFLILSLFAIQAPFWALPLLMFPIAVGTNMFNPVNNATVMNSLPLEHRGAASGMLETTRELGHAFGATAAASVLALALPAGVALLSDSSASIYYKEGFQLSTLMVVFVLASGGVLAYFHKAPVLGGAPPRTKAAEPAT
ncbi:MAG: MFS transporter, partial [SAR202 cluster bacterium]|nr:MFS transporter [SAR202 cluster bacterium]